MGNTSELGTKVFQCLKNLPSTTWNVNAPEFSPPVNKNKSCPETKAVPDMKGKIREDEEDDLGKVGKEWSKKCSGELYAGG